MAKLLYAGRSEKGPQEQKNEDYIQMADIDSEQTVHFAIVADGTANEAQTKITPAALVAGESLRFLQRAYESHREWFLKDPEYFLKESFQLVNRMIGGMQIANEAAYGSTGVSATAVIFFDETNAIAFAHIGNTRLYRFRVIPRLDTNGKPVYGKDGLLIAEIDQRQLTKDHTEAQELVRRGKMDPMQYYASPERFSLTRALGVLAEPEIDTSGGKIKDGDILMLTSDGAHYALTPDNFNYIMLTSGNPDRAVEMIMDGIKTTGYPDDASSIVMYAVPTT